MGHFFSKVSLFIDKKEAAAHLILDQDFATAPCCFYNGDPDPFVCKLVIKQLFKPPFILRLPTPSFWICFCNTPFDSRKERMW